MLEKLCEPGSPRGQTLGAAAAGHEKERTVTMDVDEDEVYLVCSCMRQEKVKRRHIGYYECIFFL